MNAPMMGKLMAYGDLIRLDLSIGAGLFLVAGEIFAIGGLPPVHTMLLGFFTLFFIAGSANISNDYFDREVDRINMPTRPLPSKRISICELWALFVLFTISGLITAAMIGFEELVIVGVLWALAFLYNVKLKELGVFGNVTVAFCLGMIFILAGVITGHVHGLILTFAALAFFFDLGEEIACDALDMEGDSVRSTKSLASAWGKEKAMHIAAGMFGIFVVLTLVPVVMGWVWYDYLLVAVVMDLWVIWCVLQLVRSDQIETGRLQIRRLYLSWGLFVFLVAFSRVIG